MTFAESTFRSPSDSTELATYSWTETAGEPIGRTHLRLRPDETRRSCGQPPAARPTAWDALGHESP